MNTRTERLQPDVPAPKKESLGRAFWYLWTGTCLNRVGQLLPAFFTIYLVHKNLATVETAGWIIGAQGAGSIVAALLGGVLSIRFGSRRTIIYSQLTTALFAGALSLSMPVWGLAIVAFLAGCTTTIHRPAGTALVAQTVPASQRARAYGLLYWASNIGVSAAPTLVGAVMELAPQLMFVLNAATSVAYALIATRMPESSFRHDDTSSPLEKSWRQSIKKAVAPFVQLPIAPFIFLNFLLSAVYLQCRSALPVDMADHGLSSSAVGLALSVNGILVVVLQPFASHFTGSSRLLLKFIIASTVIGLGFFLHGFWNSQLGYVCSIAVWTLGEVVLAPLGSSLIATWASVEEQGTHQAAYFFAWNLGVAVSAPVGLWGLENLGSTMFWSCTCALALIVALGHIVLANFYPYGEADA
ncbi:MULTISPECIES: MFS transporter [unclassified Streptomyces]|uniref:MFS transporter n=1 Tax=unclassified Streptomyces TaxID=2593676 RepID=UPI001F07FF61